ncbi:hypothetical protein JVT61DRAFT_3240 [Boletus reticuloceps]|uniref:DUF6699 domain-containing protein n=1 Tax=Boletus reticuloceps TaxID=495285 RepID=A0A8I2YRW0_9AGAM|nr:hypothetical protein JVT61DRAFT_3240 [Boletus reticuloceps]
MDPYNHPWYQAPYNPHVYVPPQYNDPYYQRASGWHPFDRAQPKHPHLNPALISDMTHLRYDFRKPPRDGILLSTFQQIAAQPVIAHPTHDIRIISKAFPWSIDIHAPAGSVVTCSAIFEGLYKMLQEPIADSEWGIVVTEKTKKETIEKAAKARQEKDRERDSRLKRIDWLGETTAFKGLNETRSLRRSGCYLGCRLARRRG